MKLLANPVYVHAWNMVKKKKRMIIVTRILYKNYESTFEDSQNFSLA